MKYIYLVDADFYRKSAALLDEMDTALLGLRLAEADRSLAALRAALATRGFAVLALDDEVFSALVHHAQESSSSLASALYQTHLGLETTRALTEWLAAQGHTFSQTPAQPQHMLLLSF